MTHVLDMQSLRADADDANHSIGSTVSVALCGSSFSAFWC
jgi:hypothetical protein